MKTENYEPIYTDPDESDWGCEGCCFKNGNNCKLFMTELCGLLEDRDGDCEEGLDFIYKFKQDEQGN